MAAEEAVTNEVVASAHVENYAVKLFLWADKEDRASHFNKNVVKAFYSAGILFDVLTICTQSELSPENAHMRKYSKWKAAYIHNCLKNGETPVPGPMEGEDDFPGEPPQEDAGPSVWQQPQNASEVVVQVILNHVTTVEVKSFSSFALLFLYQFYNNSLQPTPAPRSQPIPEPAAAVAIPQIPTIPAVPQASGATASLTPELNTKAQKYCKFAVSALDYDDTATAITNLTKALNLLQTGRES